MSTGFVDKVGITVKAGKGGDGAVSFHREKFVAAGGPDGGDGGRGGDVVMVVDDHMSTLMDFRYKRKFTAGNGANGQNKRCSGKDGETVYVKVPRGTLVRDRETGGIMADMSGDEPFTVARGGRGGWGNQHFATPTRQVPRFAKPGSPGESRDLILELKLLADVGLVGFPNVGKSTLLSSVTRARPKIADYHFTTLSPNLGVVYVAEGASFVLADIPGIIQGASEGAGLGHDFLRHIDRCRLLIHVDQQPAAVDMPQEIVAQSRAFTGALDDAGDVRQHERGALRHVNHTQIGGERGEVIVRDLRPGPGDGGEQRGFAHVGETHQTHVRQQLQLQDQVAALSGTARLRKAGDLPGRRGEVLVAPAAPAASGHGEGLVAGHIGHDAAGLPIPHQGAPGNLDVHGLAVLAGAALVLAVGAVAGGEFPLIAEIHQRGHVVVHHHHHVAAPAAVAAVRAAGRHEFFPVKGHGAVAALAGLDGDSHLVHKSCTHFQLRSCKYKKDRFLTGPLVGSLGDFVNRDLLAVLAHALEFHGAVHQSIESVVSADAHVGAGMDLRSALSDKDVAGQDELAVGPLGSQTLGLAVAAVPGAAHAFFMCHTALHLHLSNSTDHALMVPICTFV